MPLKRGRGRNKSEGTKTTTSYTRTLPPADKRSKAAAKKGGGPVTEVVVQTKATPTPGERVSPATNAIGNAAAAPLTHSHGGVLFWGLLLLVAATWDGFFSSFFKTIWCHDTKDGVCVATESKIPGQYVLGGIIFVVVLAMIADSNDAAGSVVSVVLIGLWIIFLTQNGIAIKQGQKVPSGVIVDFFSYFTRPQGNATKNTGG